MRKYIERKMKTSLIVDVNELSLLCTYFRWLVAERGSFTGLYGDDFESIFLQLWTRLEPRHAIQLCLWATTRVGNFISRIYFGFQTLLHCVSQSATLIIIILHEASATICRVCVCILQHRHGELFSLFSLFLLHKIIIIWLCLWSWLRFPIRRSCPSLLISRRGAQSEKKRVRIFILCTSTTNRPMSTNDGGRGNGEERAEFLFCSFLFFLSRAYNFFKIAWCILCSSSSEQNCTILESLCSLNRIQSMFRCFSCHFCFASSLHAQFVLALAHNNDDDDIAPSLKKWRKKYVRMLVAILR